MLPEDAPKPLLQFRCQDNGPIFLGKRIKKRKVRNLPYQSTHKTGAVLCFAKIKKVRRSVLNNSYIANSLDCQLDYTNFSTTFIVCTLDIH